MRSVTFLAVAAFCLAGLGVSGNLAAEAGSGPGFTPETLSGTYLMARTAALHHDLKTAARLYRRSLRAHPGDVSLLSSAYFYAAAAGDMRESFALARRLAKVQPDHHVAHFSLAVEALADGAYQRAIREIKASAGHSELTVTGVLVECWAEVGLGHREAAEALLQELSGPKSGSRLTADFHRALIADYLGDKNAAAAWATIAPAVTSSPRLTDAYGRYLERHGRAPEAAVLYRKVLGRMAFRPVAEAGLKRIAAGETPDRFTERPADGAAEALIGVASALNQPEQADVSLLFLRQIKYLRPDFPLADMLIASRYEAVGRHRRAVEIYQDMDADAPYSRLAMIQCADDYLNLGENAKALAVSEALIRRYPRDLEVWLSYGDTLRQLGKFQDAVYAYSRAVSCLGKREKRDWVVYFSRASAAQSAGNWPAAEADLIVALKLNPDEPQILNFLGYSWVEKHHNLHRAMAMLEKASSLAPKNGAITDSVGWAYYHLGQYDKATARLEQAVRQMPDDPTVNDHLGDAYWQVGRRREARFQWQHALAFGAADEEKAKIEQKLKNGLNG